MTDRELLMAILAQCSEEPASRMERAIAHVIRSHIAPPAGSIQVEGKFGEQLSDEARADIRKIESRTTRY